MKLSPVRVKSTLTNDRFAGAKPVTAATNKTNSSTSKSPINNLTTKSAEISNKFVKRSKNS